MSLKETLNSKLVFSGNIRKNINSTPSRNSIVPISLSRTMKTDHDDENRIPSPIRNKLSRPNTSQHRVITTIKSSDRNLNKTYQHNIINFEKEPEYQVDVNLITNKPKQIILIDKLQQLS